MPIRGERFIDSDYKATAPPYNVPNPFANKEVPNDFTTVQKILAEERSHDAVYEQTWITAEEELQVKKQTLPAEYFDPDTPDECYIAVIAYTLNTSDLYSNFNSGFRELTDEASWESFPYKSFYYLLTLALPGILSDPDPNRDIYRGIKGYHFDPEPVVADWFYYSYFASHTIDRAVAEVYLEGNGTLVEVQGGAKVAYGISKYSMFEEEKEVLVFPRNKFRVKEFRKDDTEGVDVLVLEWAGTV